MDGGDMVRSYTRISQDEAKEMMEQDDGHLCRNKGFEAMIKGYVSIKEVAEKWRLTPRRVQVLCVNGRIKGAGKIGGVWAIPADAQRPSDLRVTAGEYRNWRKKTGKSEQTDEKEQS